MLREVVLLAHERCWRGDVGSSLCELVEEKFKKSISTRVYRPQPLELLQRRLSERVVLLHRKLKRVSLTAHWARDLDEVEEFGEKKRVGSAFARAGLCRLFSKVVQDS